MSTYYPIVDTYYPVVNTYGQLCMIEEFFKKEALKPPNQRSNVCMICCRCPRCCVNM